MHPIHRRYYAEDLVRLRRASEKRRYVAAQRRGRVDPNPHQIEAVMFALQRLPEGGCILADEVGLGKTIEAGLVIAQLLAEGKSRVLIVVPRPLLGQWQNELRELFSIDAFDAADANVNVAAPGVFVVGREYAGGNRGFERLRHSPPFDLCLIDEAHEMFAGIHRRFGREGNYEENSAYALTAHRVRQIIGLAPVLLLTATPIQNSLLELWGLVQYIDRTGTLLGNKPTFERLFNDRGDGRSVAAEQARELRRRLERVVKRTLRRQAAPYLARPFVGRHAQLFRYRMSVAEKALYDDVTDYLLEPDLYAFNGRSRQLLLIGFLRRMASSTAALAKSLEGVAARLRRLLGDDIAEHASDLDDLEEEAQETVLNDDDEGEPAADVAAEPSGNTAAIRDELARVESFIRRAEALPEDSKAASLVKAVQMVMDDRPPERRKMLIFTESLTTQDYLRTLLIEQTALNDPDITLFRGINNSPRAADALRVWREEVEVEVPQHLRPSPSVAVREALKHEFKCRSTVMIASEAGAKGLNLQFCDTIVNYDLPWNPQRIEQRIGRCHRYGQKHDVTVINFLAEDNEAQKLTFEILSSKLDLFGKVLDMTDVVLQTPRSDSSEALASALGPDFESQLRRIWERARSMQDVEEELRQLRDAMEERRRELDRTHERTIGLIEQGLDESVRQVFDRIQTELAPSLEELDEELEKVLAAYLDAEGAPWGANDREGHRLLHFGALPRLPEPYREGGSVLIGRAHGIAGADPLHVGHTLVQAAVASARHDCAGDFLVRFHLKPNAAATLKKRRGSRGRLALTRVLYDGFEPEERLRATAVFEDAAVLRPAEAALELLRQPCTDITELSPPLAVTAEHLDEVVDEELFEEQCNVAALNQESFEQAMNQLDQYLADRALVLRRDRGRQTQRLANAERQREQSMGADNRAAADRRVRELECTVETLDNQLEALARHDDDIYRRWKQDAHKRRYALPQGTRLFSTQFVIE